MSILDDLYSSTYIAKYLGISTSDVEYYAERLRIHPTCHEAHYEVDALYALREHLWPIQLGNAIAGMCKRMLRKRPRKIPRSAEWVLPFAIAIARMSDRMTPNAVDLMDEIG